MIDTFTVVDMPDVRQDQRPPCPECGGIPQSRGSDWQCSQCNRRWRKIVRPRVPVYVTEQRPPCPECGGRRIFKNGNLTWMCKDCGRQWSMFKRGVRK